MPEGVDFIAAAEQRLNKLRVRTDVLQMAQMVGSCMGVFSAECQLKVHENLDEMKYIEGLLKIERARITKPNQEKPMAINVDVITERIHDDFPCMKRFIPTGAIVLMSSPTEGTVLAPLTTSASSEDPMVQMTIGYHSALWDRTQLGPWRGKIALEQ